MESKGFISTINFKLKDENEMPVPFSGQSKTFRLSSDYLSKKFNFSLVNAKDFSKTKNIF